MSARQRLREQLEARRAETRLAEQRAERAAEQLAAQRRNERAGVREEQLFQLSRIKRVAETAREQRAEDTKGKGRMAENRATASAPRKSTKPKEESKESSSDVYVPPEPDAKAKPFLDLRSGKLRALVSITSSPVFASHCL